MEVKVNQVFVFPNGSRIDLNRIISISALDKDEKNDIIIRVFVNGMNTHIQFRVGNYISEPPEDKKKEMQKIWSDFINEWEQYLREKNK